MDKGSVEASVVGIQQDVNTKFEDILLRLQGLVDSSKNDMEINYLETAISSLEKALDSQANAGESRQKVYRQLIRSLLVRFGIHGWVEDLDACWHHLAKWAGPDRTFEFAEDDTNEQGDDVVQVAAQNTQRCTKSINNTDLDAVICTVMQILSSSPMDQWPPDFANLLILLGKAVVIRYLSDGNKAALDIAINTFKLAISIRPKDTTFSYICVISLAHVEWLLFIEHGGEQRLQSLKSCWEVAAEVEKEGVELFDTGIRKLKGVEDDTQLQEAIALLKASLKFRTGPHPRRSSSLGNLASALLTRSRRLGDSAVLDESINYYRELLGLLPSLHPSRFMALNNLAGALAHRFEYRRALCDLEESITVSREALDLYPRTHPSRFMPLNNLAGALCMRFQYEGKIQDLEEAINNSREAINLQMPTHSDCSSSLGNLAATFFTRFENLGEFQDLQESINLYRQALDQLQPPYLDRSMLLKNLGMALSSRFNHKGAFEDLEESIASHRAALDTWPKHHPNRTTSATSLAAALFARFRQKGALEDLDECIILHREALVADNTNRSASLSSLARSLFSRFQHKGSSRDLQECISLYQEALDLRPPTHPDHSMALTSLAATLFCRFEYMGAFQDLEESIRLGREAVDLLPLSHPDRLTSLGNLAAALSIRFEHRGELPDLEQCITLHREVLAARPPPHPDRSTSLSNLGMALSTRFNYRGAFQDLQECISLHREALGLRPPPNSSRFVSLNNLAMALWTQFHYKGVFLNLEECITLNREALDLLPPSHPDRSVSLGNLASALSTRFDRKGVFGDLEECISLYRATLALQPTPHPERSGSLNNLANALFARFKRNSAFRDIEECISLNRAALDLRAAPHPDRSSSLFNLAEAISSRYECGGVSPEDPQIALDYYQEAAKYPTGYLIARIDITQRWATHAQKHYPALTLDAYNYSMELLPQLASLDLTLQQRQDVLQHSRNLVSNAATYAIDARKLDIAVVFLSTGRSIFWSQALQLRTPVNKLMTSHSTLAERYISASRQLENASYSERGPVSTQSVHRKPGPSTGVSLHRLANQRQQALEEIRRIPGYERFLLPPSFLSLQPAAKNGPIIFLNASGSGCDVVIMRGTKSLEHIPLSDINLSQLEALKALIQMLSAAGMRGTGIEVPDDTVNTLQRLLGRDLVLESSSFLNEETFRLPLECLWLKVVKPVVLALGAKKTNSPDRVWWCPTGPFTSLPIHAAGVYSAENEPIDCIFHYAVSSYCTSPQDLLHSTPQITNLFKATAIIEPEAPHSAALPATLTELKEITKHIPHQQHLITHVGLKDAPNRVEDLISDIQRSSMVHFGCHGMQDPNDPLESYLHLSGGKLTISKIIKECRVPEGALAYLSACETAKGDETWRDESLNLVATMMFAGFRSVVGTLWSIFDEDAPIVADIFYGHLFRHGKKIPPDVRDAAYGIHLATKGLRDRGKPFYNWVPYVHYGV